MRRFAGACRFVFNRALALQNENHEAGNKYIPYGKMASWLVEWKNATETQWLKDAPSQPLQQSLKDLERAYKNFFQKRAAFPRFKKRGQNDAFRYPQGVKLDQENSRIFLPKLGWMRYRNSRQVTGVVKNVTVSQSCGKWYISIQTENEVSTPVHPSALMVGLDLAWLNSPRCQMAQSLGLYWKFFRRQKLEILSHYKRDASMLQLADWMIYKRG